MPDGVHVIIVDPVQAEVNKLREAFEECHATVHLATTRQKAITSFFAIVGTGVHPRALVTSWLLNVPGSKDWQFFKMMNKEHHNFATTMIGELRKIDPRIVVVITHAERSD